MIQIVLNDVMVGVGHGQTPEGEKAMGINFIDPESKIAVQVTFVGQGLTDFVAQCKEPSEIEIVAAIPEGISVVKNRRG